MNREELAWAAGLFDGEGNVRAALGPRKAYTKATLSITQNHRQVLDRFQSAVGVGKVFGPYHAMGKKNPHYNYIVGDFPKVQAVVAMLWTWLSPIKKAQAKDALLRSRGSLRTKMVAWLHCSNGHPLNEKNRYQKGMVVVCRPCAAESMRQSRRRRELGIAEWT